MQNTAPTAPTTPLFLSSAIRSTLQLNNYKLEGEIKYKSFSAKAKFLLWLAVIPKKNFNPIYGRVLPPTINVIVGHIWTVLAKDREWDQTSYHGLISWLYNTFNSIFIDSCLEAVMPRFRTLKKIFFFWEVNNRRVQNTLSITVRISPGESISANVVCWSWWRGKERHEDVRRGVTTGSAILCYHLTLSTQHSRLCCHQHVQHIRFVNRKVKGV